MGERTKTKRFYFLTNEDALVFAAKVNGRLAHIRHFEHALATKAPTPDERAFLIRTVARLRAEIAGLRA